jgi:hypothetical protein
VRVADAEVGVDRERIRRAGRGGDESIGERERMHCTTLDADRRRQRRLLREQQRQRLIDRRVPINAVSAAHDERRSRHWPPGDADARLKSTHI